jgi:uncharacterized cupin superfamily protein
VTDWFVKNVRDARWYTHPKFGSSGHVEPEYGEFEQLGINVRVLEPGQPNCLYHRENLQEDFLVLAGECLLLVDGQERPLKAWDFVHMPPDVEHVFVGAGDGPCVILMVGARSTDEKIFYPTAPVAQKHGAAAKQDTPSPQEAYAPFGKRSEGRPASWDSLPWA